MGGKWKWIVMVAVYASNLIGSATLFSSGVMYVAMLERYGGNKAKTAVVFSLNSGLLCFLGPVATVVVNRYNCRVSVVAGAIFLVMSAILSAFVNSVDLLIVTYGILGDDREDVEWGIGNSLALVPNSLILCFHFKKHRNLILILSNGVIGLALFIASPLTMYLVDKYTLCGTFLIFGALNAHTFITGMVSKPSLEMQSKNTQFKDKTRNNSEVTVKKPKLDIMTTVTSLHSKLSRVNVAFILFLISTSAWNFILAVCVVHLPNFALINGFDTHMVTLLMACLSICNTIGRFLPVLVASSNRIDISVLHIVAMGIVGVVSVTFPSLNSFKIGKYLFSASVGLFTGLSNSLMTPITIKIVGLKKISTAHGLVYFACGVGSFLGPIVAGFLYNMTGSYQNSFIVAGIISVIGCACALAGRCIMQHGDTREQSENFQPKVMDSKDVLSTLVEQNGDVVELTLPYTETPLSTSETNGY